jgi:hypothetical protein
MADTVIQETQAMGNWKCCCWEPNYYNIRRLLFLLKQPTDEQIEKDDGAEVTAQTNTMLGTLAQQMTDLFGSDM